MTESLTIICDRCHERVGKASRTRIRWSAEPTRREPTDLCPACRDSVMELLGIIAPANNSGVKPR
jgi:hypothetical protein